MPSPTLPPGWSNPDTANVQWGVDIDRTESVTQSGFYGIHFLDTTPAVDPEIVSNLIPVENGVGVSVSALWRTSSIGASDWVEVEVNLYADDRVTVVGTISRQQVLAAANTWQWVGVDATSASARYAQITLRKNNLAYDAYVDRSQAEMWISGWGRRKDVSQSIPTSAWTVVDFDTDDRTVSHGGGNLIAIARHAEAAGVITIGPSGQYNLSACVEFATFTNAANVEIRFKVVGTGGAVTKYPYGMLDHVPAGDKSRVIASAVNEHLISGDQVSVEVWHDEGGAVNVVNGGFGSHDSNTYFRGVRVGVL